MDKKTVFGKVSRWGLKSSFFRDFSPKILSGIDSATSSKSANSNVDMIQFQGTDGTVQTVDDLHVPKRS